MAWKGFSQEKNQKNFGDISQKEDIFSQYAGTSCWLWSLWEWNMEAEVTSVRWQWKILLSATFFSVITKKHGAACLSHTHLLLPLPPPSDLTNKTTTPDWNSARDTHPAIKILDFVRLFCSKDGWATNDTSGRHKGHAERLRWKLSNGVPFICFLGMIRG